MITESPPQTFLDIRTTSKLPVDDGFLDYPGHEREHSKRAEVLKKAICEVSVLGVGCSPFLEAKCTSVVRGKFVSLPL